MDLPTYPRFQRPTIAGLVVSGRLAPKPEPKAGAHAEGVNPAAVSVGDLARRIADEDTRDWWEGQLAHASTVRLPRIVEPVGGAA